MKVRAINYISVAILAFVLTFVFMYLYSYYSGGSTNMYVENRIPSSTTADKVAKIEEIRKLFQDKCATIKTVKDGKTLFGKMCKKVDNIKINEDTQSYTINKEKIFLCLTDQHNDFYSNNMLVYVLLHEFAHTLCNSIGHTPEFHDIFENLLKEAIDRKLYDPSIPVDPEYCKHNKKK